MQSLENNEKMHEIWCVSYVFFLLSKLVLQ